MQQGAYLPNMEYCYKQQLCNIQDLSDIKETKLEYAKILINI